jgi:hypothetical protein
MVNYSLKSNKKFPTAISSSHHMMKLLNNIGSITSNTTSENSPGECKKKLDSVLKEV